MKEERQAILRICREITEQERITYVISNLKYFGEWVKWGAAMQLDSRYHNLLAYHSDSSLRFRLCATKDVLPTESVRKVWQLAGATGMCLFWDNEDRSYTYSPNAASKRSPRVPRNGDMIRYY